VRCYEVRWRPAGEAGPAPTESWLVTGPDPDGVRTWVEQLDAAGIAATALPWGAGEVPATGASLLVRGAFDDDGLDPAGAATDLGTAGLELLRQHLAGPVAHPGPQVVVCSVGAATPAPPGGRTPLRPAELAQGALTGLAKAVIAEHPQVRCVQVDLDPAAGEPPVPELLARAAGVAGSGHLAVRGGEWWEAGLVADRVTGAAERTEISGAGTYLVTGGFGALGGEVAQWLVDQGARTLLLAGRRLPGDAPLLDKLRTAEVRVETVAVDVADPGALTILEDRLAGMPPLRGIVHAAGIRDDAALENLDPARVRRVLDPKVRGGWLVHLLAERQEPELVVLFSSLASVTGSAGQANYVLANTFLDGLAAYRRQHGMPALSIGWGPWAGGGMAAELADTMARSGLRPLAAGEALDALAEVLSRPTAHAAVAAVDWSRYAAAGAGRLAYSLLEGLVGAATPVTPGNPSPGPGVAALPPPAELADAVLADPDRVRGLIGAYVSDRVGMLLGWSRAQRAEIRPTLGQLRLSELGIDSLMAVQLRNQFLGELATDFPPQFLLGDHTVRDVVERAVQQLTVRQMMTVEDTGDEDVEILTL
jgi:hypothetical protein